MTFSLWDSDVLINERARFVLNARLEDVIQIFINSIRPVSLLPEVDDVYNIYIYIYTTRYYFARTNLDHRGLVPTDIHTIA